MKYFFKKLNLFASLSLILCVWNPLHASAKLEQVSLINRPYPTASKVTDTTTLTKYNLLQGKQTQSYTSPISWSGPISWSLTTLNQYGDILYNNNRIGTSRFSDMSFYQSLNGSTRNLLTQRAFDVVKGHQYQVSYQLKNSSYGTMVPQFKMSIRQGSEFDGEIIKQLSLPFDSMTYQNFQTVDFSGEVSFQTQLYSEQVFVVMSGSNLSIIDLDQNIIEARRDVEQLFTDTIYTKLNEFVTQKELYNVKNTVDLVVNSAERTFLLQYTNLAQEFLDAIQMSLTTTELGDNRENLNSRIIKGTTYPHAYVRITGNSNLPAASLISPFKDEPENFTVQADENGNYTVNLENTGHFIAGEKVVVVANRHGKRLSETVTVKDQTIPTGNSKTAHNILKDALPTPDKFVSDLTDSNPNNKKIAVEYSIKNTSEKITEMLKKSGKYIVYVTIKDDASNSTEIQSELIVYDSNSLLESTNFQIDQEELIRLSHAEMLDRFLKDSQTQAYLISDTNKIDLVNKLQIRGLGSFKKEVGTYALSYFLAKEDSGLTKDLISEFTVTVTQPGASKPIDPTNPQSGNETDAENEGTGNIGYLRVDYAPSSFDFGKVTTSFLNKTYQANQPFSISGKPLTKQWIQVSDTRLSHNGWTLNVSQSTPFIGSDGSTLEGAQLKIPKGMIYNTASNSDPILDNSIMSQEVSLSETPTAILTTPKANASGKSITTNVWDPTQVSLYVPGGSAKNKVQYQTTINWSLVTEVPN
ncbi:hypothetical protein CYV26_07505 [Carnobacterium maltaromaticum]|uniref:WxL domain-containing protein n=1 Tax=Carnobacterium maltaromaticum TaxID=2751 RepID=UPI000C7814CB|nr:WxL domain-containing protein [Carnobacterium maltaromaticum]PLS35220.1 hypothetical protein CYV30_10510 [Carnobacterium maltaromaticum]PLS35633.1 hypothetical protein CYV31_10490 [Carnobacterium maltaromaticum]PLS36083.1 hypothetical protein CYV33_07500 [Carnobacterium maltaromaticum]PLS42540.1 hypothetical protein CYV28_10445 [Carnobacterium maltaromaticum]PLS45561.1 hypothetical protein CYV27_07495 [Carnobacterium maltaromaticum]